MNIAWRVTRRDQPQMLSYVNLRITTIRLIAAHLPPHQRPQHA